MAFKILTTNGFDSPQGELYLGIHEKIKKEAESLGLDFCYKFLNDFSEESMIKEADGFDGLIIGSEPFTAPMIKALSNKLKIIIRFGVGFDSVDLDAAADLGIPVANTPGANSVSVAEHALMLILGVLKKCTYYDHQTKKGEWSELVGAELSCKKVGLIGFGKVAQILARFLKVMGADVLAYDPYFNKEIADDLGVRYSPIEEMISDVDIVSLHLPHTKKTDKMIDKSFLNSMKTGAILINTARGALVDESALVNALKSGSLGGAGLDTFQNEPLESDNLLRNIDQVILTPHVAASTKESLEKTYRMAIKTAALYLSKGICENNVNPSFKDKISE